MLKITNKIKRIVSVLLFAAVCLSLFSCAKTGTFDVNKKTVMTVNGEKVTYDEYKFYYYSAAYNVFGLESTDWTDSKNLEALKTEAEYAIRCKYAIRKLCDLYDIELTRDDKKDIDAIMQYYIDEQGGKDEYRKWLKELRTTGTVFRDYLEIYGLMTDGYLYGGQYEWYLSELLFTGYDNVIKVDVESVTDDVKKNFYRYTQIFIEFDENDVWSENRAEIDEALAKINGGADFYDVAKEYSEWTADVEKGQWGTAGQLLVEIEKAVGGLEVGEMSGVIESDIGHHIILRLPIDDDYISANIDDMTVDSASRRYNEYIEKTAKELTVEYTEYGNSLTFDLLTSKEE